MKELGIKRSGLVILTKLFYGSGDSEEPNAMGLSRKQYGRALLKSQD